jgi:anti-sigma regulatory factor (Ser/Thr protein kinase)
VKAIFSAGIGGRVCPSHVRWPLQARLELAALATAPACARGHVRAVLYEWGLTGRKDTAELLVSELVTNAVLAYERVSARADVPVVGIWLACDGFRLVIHVWDGSDDMPIRQDAGPDQEGGRGLMLVESLSRDWGAYRTANGKVVWVSL